MFSLRAFALAFCTSLTLVLPATAVAQAPAPDKSGGAAFQEPTPPPPPDPVNLVVPGSVAQLMPDGSAAAPADAPAEVQQAIWAANKIQDKPYIYGGGHRRFEDRGYDCSGTVSYALNGGGLLDSPLDSSSFMKWGAAGKGQWITVYTNPGHAYAVIAGLRLDTSAAAARATSTRSSRRPTSAARAGGRPSAPLAATSAAIPSVSKSDGYAWSDYHKSDHMEGRCRGRHVRTVLHCNQGQDQPDARQGRGSG